MKINPITGAMRFVDIVQGQGKKDGQARQDRQQDQADQNSNDQEKEASPEELDAAIEAFQGDSQTQANGLHATVVNQGPGLRVVLKDGGGAIVRQFTGEEFLRLREAAGLDGKVRGKILDQKL